jgi:hypothetical protein
MNLLRRIGAWLLLLLAAIGLVVTLATAFGVWFVRPPLNESVEALMESADGIVGYVDDALVNLETVLARAESGAAEVARQVEASRAAGVNPVVAAAEARLGVDVAATAATVQEVAEGAVTAIVALDNTLDQAARLPGLQVPTLGDKPEQIQEQMLALRDGLETVQNAAAERDGERVENAAETVVTNIAALRTGVVEIDREAKMVRQGIERVRTTFPTVSMWSSVIISGFGLLMAAGQWQLMASAWRNIRRPGKPAAAAVEAAPAAAA